MSRVSWNKYRGSWRAMMLFPLLAGLMLACSTKADHLSSEETTASPLSDIQAAVSTYMYLPQFSFPGFASQVFGEQIRSMGYDPVNRFIYLHVPTEMALSGDFDQLSAVPSAVEVASGYDAIDWLGPDSKRDQDSSRIVIRFPAKDMLLDSTDTITRRLGKHRFILSMEELGRCFRHQYAYNSPALALAPGPGDLSYVIANHVAPMSAPDDPILSRVTSQLLSGSLPTREDSAQRLLDFVTTSIAYTHHGDLEIFMRPLDVLLAGEADCSGKVILYGSLLNQIDIPFLLVYLDGHITIGVQGAFPQSNGMFFRHEGETYTLAETTAEGFEIGKSELIEPMETWHYKYLQKPGHTEKLFDLWRNDSLEFADRVDLAGYRAPSVH